MKLLISKNALKVEPPAMAILQIDPPRGIYGVASFSIKLDNDHELEYTCPSGESISLTVAGVRFNPDQWRPLYRPNTFPTKPEPATLKFSGTGWGVWLKFQSGEWIIRI
jgi:hypothetical protein